MIHDNRQFSDKAYSLMTIIAIIIQVPPHLYQVIDTHLELGQPELDSEENITKYTTSGIVSLNQGPVSI